MADRILATTCCRLTIHQVVLQAEEATCRAARLISVHFLNFAGDRLSTVSALQGLENEIGDVGTGIRAKGVEQRVGIDLEPLQALDLDSQALLGYRFAMVVDALEASIVASGTGGLSITLVGSG